MSNNLRGYIYAALSSSSYGVNAFAPILYAVGLTTNSVLFYRYLFATLLTVGLMFFNKESFRLTLKELLLICPMGVLFAYSSWSLFEAYKYMGVSLAATVLFVYPALVAMLMWAFFREKPGKITLFAIPIVFLGIVLLDFEGITQGSSSPLGLVIVLSSALSYAIYMVVVQKSCLSNMSSTKLSFYSLVFGLLFYVIMTGFCTEVQPLGTAKEWTVVLALALFPSLISMSTMAKAIKLVGSTATAVLGAFEPIASVLIGVCLYGERPVLLSWIGMVVILSSVTAVVAQNRIVRIGGKFISYMQRRIRVRKIHRLRKTIEKRQAKEIAKKA